MKTLKLNLALASAFFLTAGAQAIPIAAAVNVKTVDAAGLKKAIAAHKGHVVVVNFWATWCGPCVAEFPALVRMSNADKRKGLVFLAVSADAPKDLNAKVKPFLAKQGGAFPSYLEHSADPQTFINAFDPKWQGDLPRTFIYDKRGHLAKELAGEQTAATLAKAVAPLLK